MRGPTMEIVAMVFVAKCQHTDLGQCEQVNEPLRAWLRKPPVASSHSVASMCVLTCMTNKQKGRGIRTAHRQQRSTPTARR